MTLTKQITNAWQVMYNGEPFWDEFIKTDISRSLEEAGFQKSQIFEFYEPLGQGEYYFFGSQKI